MNVKGRMKGIRWLALLALAIGTAAVAHDGPNPSGGDIPIPLMDTNQRVELADGEQYTLWGKVVYYDRQAYLEVDLEKHAWLKSRKREKLPYYPLGEIAGGWRRWQGRGIQVQVAAHGLVLTNGAYPQYVIWLAPVSDPIDLSRLPGRK